MDIMFKVTNSVQQFMRELKAALLIVTITKVVLNLMKTNDCSSTYVPQES